MTLGFYFYAGRFYSMLPLCAPIMHPCRRKLSFVQFSCSSTHWFVLIKNSSDEAYLDDRKYCFQILSCHNFKHLLKNRFLKTYVLEPKFKLRCNRTLITKDNKMGQDVTASLKCASSDPGSPHFNTLYFANTKQI